MERRVLLLLKYLYYNRYSWSDIKFKNIFKKKNFTAHRGLGFFLLYYVYSITV